MHFVCAGNIFGTSYQSYFTDLSIASPRKPTNIDDFSICLFLVNWCLSIIYNIHMQQYTWPISLFYIKIYHQTSMYFKKRHKFSTCTSVISVLAVCKCKFYNYKNSLNFLSTTVKKIWLSTHTVNSLLNAGNKCQHRIVRSIPRGF